MKTEEDEVFEDIERRQGGFAKDMTLRDHFAAEAMQGILSGLLADGQDVHWDEICRNAYWQADAMLKRREAK